MPEPDTSMVIVGCSRRARAPPPPPPCASGPRGKRTNLFRVLGSTRPVITSHGSADGVLALDLKLGCEVAATRAAYAQRRGREAIRFNRFRGPRWDPRATVVPPGPNRHLLTASDSDILFFGISGRNRNRKTSPKTNEAVNADSLLCVRIYFRRKPVSQLRHISQIAVFMAKWRLQK